MPTIWDSESEGLPTRARRTIFGSRGDFISSTSRPDLTLYDWADQPWREEASCNGVDPMLFFPERGQPGEEIRELCFQCPVRLDCLAYSVETMPKFGWYGGHPEDGRKQVRRLMRANPGLTIDRADSIVLLDSIRRMNRKKKAAAVNVAGGRQAKLSRLAAHKETPLAS